MANICPATVVKLAHIAFHLDSRHYANEVNEI